MSKVYQPSDVILTVDALILVNHDSVLLIERGKEPFMNKLVMPGGHVEATDASLVAAIQREVAEEVSLHIEQDNFKYVTVLDASERDPRPGRRVSIVFVAHVCTAAAEKAVAATDAKSIKIVKIKDLTEDQVGFDHWQAINV